MTKSDLSTCFLRFLRGRTFHSIHDHLHFPLFRQGCYWLLRSLLSSRNLISFNTMGPSISFSRNVWTINSPHDVLIFHLFHRNHHAHSIKTRNNLCGKGCKRVLLANAQWVERLCSCEGQGCGEQHI